MSDLDLSVINKFSEGTLAKTANPAKPRINTEIERGESVAKNAEKWLISPNEAKNTLANMGFTAPDYPINALGALSEVAKAIQDEAQVSAAMAGQSVLAAAALATQHTANVKTLAGTKPLSLYVLTIAESSEGKSTAEIPALQAIRDYQRKQGNEYAQKIKEIEKASKFGKKEYIQDIPQEPWLTMKDATIVGIRRSFNCGLPSQGAFTSEAAVMMSGYGMSPENRAKTAGTFNALWDDGELSVARGTAGRIQLYDRRFSKHFLIQPDAVRESLNDPLLETIGYWSRYIIAWPEPAPPRKARTFEPEKNKAMRWYWSRCEELLTNMPTEDCSGLPTIKADAEAIMFIKAFFEQMEAKAKGGSLSSIKPYALRATEQLFRVAGVLAAFSGEDTLTIDAAKNSAELVTYSLETWRGIFGDRQEAEAATKALRLFEWIYKQKDGVVSKDAILQKGPRPRGKSTRDKSLAVLELNGLIEHIGSGYWAIKKVNHSA